MASITLDQARPGMVLAAEVFDRRGRLLMGEGHELTDRHIQALRQWGVLRLDVDDAGEEPEPESPLTPEVLAHVEEDMQRLFVNAGGPHPFLDELRAAAWVRATREANGHAPAWEGA